MYKLNNVEKKGFEVYTSWNLEKKKIQKNSLVRCCRCILIISNTYLNMLLIFNYLSVM